VHGGAGFCALGAIVADAVVVGALAAATSLRVVCLTAAAGRAAFMQAAASAVNALGVLNRDVNRHGSRGALAGPALSGVGATTLAAAGGDSGPGAVARTGIHLRGAGRTCVHAMVFTEAWIMFDDVCGECRCVRSFPPLWAVMEKETVELSLCLKAFAKRAFALLIVGE
jgi:hypothetical protein